jgi:superfamily I DNA and/or RNA helicase
MRVLELLRTKRETPGSTENKPGDQDEGLNATAPLTVTVFSPYSRQVRLLRERLSNSPRLAPHTEVHTIDGFQGREAEVIVFTTVRSNANADIGFLADERRLNVALTRSQLARIIIGDETTLKGDAGRTKPRGVGDETTQNEVEDETAKKGHEVWDRAVKDCARVELPVPNDS